MKKLRSPPHLKFFASKSNNNRKIGDNNDKTMAMKHHKVLSYSFNSTHTQFSFNSLSHSLIFMTQIVIIERFLFNSNYDDNGVSEN
jgi:hypothetical protein